MSQTNTNCHSGLSGSQMNKSDIDKKIVMFFMIIVIVIISFVLVYSDTSDLQSAQEKNISLKPCTVVDGIHMDVTDFEVGVIPHICGKVLSKYLPLELNYYLVYSTDNNVILDEHIKITSYEFVIDLPPDLDVGHYEFEIRAGRRKHIASTNFEISR